MSSTNPFTDHRLGAVERTTDLVARGIVTPLSALSFWIAIALPAVYLPLLVTGIESTEGLRAFCTLVGLHLVALIGGRHYR